MKYLKTLLILLTLGSITAFVTKKDKEGLDPKTVKYLHKRTDWRQVDDSLFIFRSEVSNLEYRHFLRNIKQQVEPKLYEGYKVDSTKWDSALNYSKPIREGYHRLPEYQDYPVVNISHEAAVAYCEWLTNIYNTGTHSLKHFFKKIKIRLPTKQEWILAAEGGREVNMFAWGGPYVRNYDGELLANFRGFQQCCLVPINDSMFIDPERSKKVTYYPGQNVTTPVISYWPNDYGLYNMCGNVAEMVDEPGTSVGGSWKSTAYYMRLDVDADPYEGWIEPSPFIGFRPVMEVIEE